MTTHLASMIPLPSFIIATALLVTAQESQPAKPALEPSKVAAPTGAPAVAPNQDSDAPKFTPPPESPAAVDGGLFTRFYHEDGTLAREGYLKDGVRTGIWKAWFLDGGRALHGAYKDYQRVGSWVLYSEDGKSRTHAIYDQEGKRDGVWTTYFVSDKGTEVVKAVAGWRHGRKQGAHERYARSGKLMSLTEFHGGRKHGRSLKFSRGGKNKVEEGQYSDGVQVGPWKIYRNDGVLQSEGTFDKGQRIGEWIEYYANASRKSVGTFKEGLQDGAWQGFYKQGERRYRGTFEKGFLVGDYIEWWPAGDKKGEGKFVAGKYDGPWTFWDREGREDPTKTGTYRDGDLVR